MTKFAQRTSQILVAVIFASLTTATFAATFISVTVAPPPLPVYAQPVAPGPGFIWTPGYWAYGPEGYFWVPGTWVVAPFTGALWTPGYWAWSNGVYGWRAGYWGPRVGFYGGVNYGFGYTGVGYHGGYWNNGAFYYNRAVNNVNVASVHNTYNTTVINNDVTRRVSYNGGTGGTRAQPTAAERSVAAEQHTPPIAAQQEHERSAAGNRACSRRPTMAVRRSRRHLSRERSTIRAPSPPVRTPIAMRKRTTVFGLRQRTAACPQRHPTDTSPRAPTRVTRRTILKDKATPRMEDMRRTARDNIHADGRLDLIPADDRASCPRET